jgi:ABC-2 type transport system ATP-binding protein
MITQIQQQIASPLSIRSGVRTVDVPATMIDVRDMSRSFSEDVGVFDINLEVPSGTIFGLIGPSGCGKTTTVRLLTGLYEPDRGNLKVLGRDPNTFSTAIREQIGYMPQQFVLYPYLTVAENLNFVASLYGMGYFSRRQRVKYALDLVELSDVKRRLGSQLSGGMKRRLELACALIHDPLLLFADEPTAGIDPVLRGKFWDHFRELRDQGRTLFMTTQYVGEAAYCDLVGVMRAGRLVHLDTPDGLRRKALGGEVIKLVVTREYVLDAVELIARHPAVTDVQRSRSQPGLLYVYTADASAAMPLIFGLFADHPTIAIEQAEEYQPPFDDIFIRLMEQAQGAGV